MKNNNRRSLQYSFEIILDFLEAEYTSAFNFKICLKRGNKIFETKNTMKYESGKRREVQIGEVFNLNANLHFKEDSDTELDDKVYKIYLQVYTKSGFKNATFAELNLSKLVNLDSVGNPVIISENFSNINRKDKLDLEFAKHPFNFLKLKLTFISKYVEAVNFNEMSADGDDRDRGMKSKLLNEGHITSVIKNNLNETQNVSISNNNDNNNNDSKKADIMLYNDQEQRKNSYYNGSSQEEEIFLLNEQIRVLNEKVDTLEKEKLLLSDQLNKTIIPTVNNSEPTRETKNEKRVS
jgi:hypothetical protein